MEYGVWGMQHVWGEERRIQGFGEEREGKRPLGRPRDRWENNIMIGLHVVGCGCMDWIGSGSGQGQVEGICECGVERSGSAKCRGFVDQKDCAAQSE